MQAKQRLMLLDIILAAFIIAPFIGISCPVTCFADGQYLTRKTSSENGAYLLRVSGHFHDDFSGKVRLALSGSDGKELWEKDVVYHGLPTVSNLGDVAVPQSNAVIFYDERGHIRGTFRIPGQQFSFNCSDDEFFYSLQHKYSLDGGKYCVCIRNKETRLVQLHYLDQQGSRLWHQNFGPRYNLSKIFFAPPSQRLVVDDFAFSSLGYSNRLYLLDSQNGKVVREIAANSYRSILASVIGAGAQNDEIYIHDANGSKAYDIRTGEFRKELEIADYISLLRSSDTNKLGFAVNGLRFKVPIDKTPYSVIPELERASKMSVPGCDQLIYELSKHSGNPTGTKVIEESVEHVKQKFQIAWMLTPATLKQREYRDGDIAVDDSGSVWVGGYSDGEYGLIKYNSRGQNKWTVTHSSWTRGTDIAVDNAGNAYVAVFLENNMSSKLTKYSSKGVVIWEKDFPSHYYETPPPQVAVDSRGNVLVAWRDLDLGNETGHSFLHKYDPNGEIVWQKEISQNPLDMAVDQSGDIYLGEADIRLTKYSSEGRMVWEKTHNELSSDKEWIEALSIDDKGNVYVGANLTGFECGQDGIWLAKYDGTGKREWAVVYRIPNSKGDCSARIGVRDITLDRSGNLFAVGYSNLGLWIGKFEKNGDFGFSVAALTPITQPEKHRGPPYASCDRADGISHDRKGNLYLIGHCRHKVDRIMFVLKLSPTNTDNKLSEGR